MRKLYIAGALVLASCSSRKADVGPLIGPTTGCPAPIGELRCGYLCEWTPDDDAQMDFSRTRCKQIYGRKSCLRKLTKLGPRAYTAICWDGDRSPHLHDMPAPEPTEPRRIKE